MSTATAHTRPDEFSEVFRHGVLTLTGYGLRLAVERGHLITEDGIGFDRRRLRITRVGSGLLRVIVAGHAGTVSLDALRWLYETGVAFVQLGPDAEVLTVGGPRGLADVRVRRGQALAASNGVGVTVGKRLIGAKIEGQRQLLRHLPGGSSVATQLAAMLPVLDTARTLDRVRYIESQAAAAYWACWERVPVTFPKRELAKVPAHWRVAGPRRSGISTSAIKATSPVHAILNYLYAILEAEATLALRVVGCDPAMGVIHADGKNRDSFACDLMEPVRPMVDAFVLRMLRERTFLKADFFERRDGNCRLLPSLTVALSATAAEWGERLAPYAEDVASQFTQRPPTPTMVEEEEAPLPAWIPRLVRSPLTGQNRRRRFRPTEGLRVPKLALLPLGNRCRQCGIDMGPRDRDYCDECLATTARSRMAKATAAQKALRTIGKDRRSSPEARAKHSAFATKQASLNHAWEDARGDRPSRRVFLTTITPRLKPVPVVDLMRATGLGRSFCSNLRAGRSVPHPRHWDRIVAVADAFERKHGTNGVDLTHIDLARWRRDIRPHLKRLGAATIQRVTGLSRSYARRILHGHHIPRPVHWPALLAVIEDDHVG